MNSPYSKESVRLGILHYLLGRGLAGIAGFVTIILMVRYMDVQSYAGFTALTGLIAFSGVCAGLGLDRVISRYIPEARLERGAKELAQLIWLLTGIKLFASIVISIIFYILWEYILRIFHDVHLMKFPISLFYFIVAETLFQHFSAVLQALIKQKELTRILIVQWLGRLIMIGVIMLIHGNINLDNALWIMAIPELAGVFVFILLMQHEINNLYLVEKLQFENDRYLGNAWPNWPSIFRMAANNYGFTLLAAPPQGYFMKMLAAIYLPAHYVAAYGFFLNIAERARQYIPLHFFYNLLEPVMIARYLTDQNFSELSYRCQLLYKSNLLLLVPAIAWIAVSGDYIDMLLTGGKFQGLTWVLVVVMAQLTIGSHVVLLQLILNSIEKSRYLIKASLNALPIMLLAIVISVKTQAVYLLFTPLIFSLIMNTSLIAFLKQSGHPYKPSWRMQRGILISGFLAFLVVYTMKEIISFTSNSLVLMTTTLIVILAVYSILIWLMKAIDKSEVSLVESFFKAKTSSY